MKVPLIRKRATSSMPSQNHAILRKGQPKSHAVLPAAKAIQVVTGPRSGRRQAARTYHFLKVRCKDTGSHHLNGKSIRRTVPGIIISFGRSGVTSIPNTEFSIAHNRTPVVLSDSNGSGEAIFPGADGHVQSTWPTHFFFRMWPKAVENSVPT